MDVQEIALDKADYIEQKLAKTKADEASGDATTTSNKPDKKKRARSDSLSDKDDTELVTEKRARAEPSAGAGAV
jgi:hypothetical protein